ncbi:TetR family transcriptional regulator C-terminal domain-containing protein [Streptomyces sp. GC420]|uniref:TetR family transcriptional regulator C-terminal domain-containing protein n=1 Tax=Streptomyces sp. GC420 TaxID=2697568 RepID=UPI001AA169E4|nr:TetR family transcriptional regulator [Streptomyces sp. GC420]
MPGEPAQTQDALATAYVQDRADAWFAHMRRVADKVDDPREKLLAIFTVVVEHAKLPTFRGCPMLNTHTEFPDREHPASGVAVAHKQQVRDWMRDLAADAGADDPEQLADELLLVLNGAYSTATVLGPDGPARRTRELARRLIKAACNGPGRGQQQLLRHAIADAGSRRSSPVDPPPVRSTRQPASPPRMPAGVGLIPVG